jgi:hypothetical protein
LLEGGRESHDSGTDDGGGKVEDGSGEGSAIKASLTEKVLVVFIMDKKGSRSRAPTGLPVGEGHYYCDAESMIVKGGPGCRLRKNGRL